MSTIFDQPLVHQLEEHHTLWNNEYEPKILKDVIGNQMIAETLEGFLKSDIPNLLFCGPNGCGKTTMAKILVHEYLGKQYDHHSHLRIIGSIYRGKNVVSEKTDKKTANDSNDVPNINNFIRKKSLLPAGKCRIVTIYDFECMTNEAQMALRRIIELHCQKVRFIFICNNLGKVIEAIQSRTLILRFQPIPSEEIDQRIKVIARDKGRVFPEDIFEAITLMANGDLKQAINYLQVFSHNREVTLESFYHIFNIPSFQCINEIITTCLSGQGPKAFVVLGRLVDNGYNVTDILEIMIKLLLQNKKITEEQRVLMVEEIIKVITANEQVPSVLHLYKLLVAVINKNQI